MGCYNYAGYVVAQKGGGVFARCRLTHGYVHGMDFHTCRRICRFGSRSWRGGINSEYSNQGSSCTDAGAWIICRGMLYIAINRHISRHGSRTIAPCGRTGTNRVGISSILYSSSARRCVFRRQPVIYIRHYNSSHTYTGVPDARQIQGKPVDSASCRFSRTGCLRCHRAKQFR